MRPNKARDIKKGKSQLIHISDDIGAARRPLVIMEKRDLKLNNLSQRKNIGGPAKNFELGVLHVRSDVQHRLRRVDIVLISSSEICCKHAPPLRQSAQPAVYSGGREIFSLIRSGSIP